MRLHNRTARNPQKACVRNHLREISRAKTLHACISRVSRSPQVLTSLRLIDRQGVKNDDRAGRNKLPCARSAGSISRFAKGAGRRRRAWPGFPRSAAAGRWPSRTDRPPGIPREDAQENADCQKQRTPHGKVRRVRVAGPHSIARCTSLRSLEAPRRRESIPSCYRHCPRRSASGNRCAIRRHVPLKRTATCLPQRSRQGPAQCSTSRNSAAVGVVTSDRAGDEHRQANDEGQRSPNRQICWRCR